MLRLVNLLLAATAVGGAFALYAVKHEVRALDQRVAADERRLERIHSDIAVLRAERALLARPERIESLARAMGLGPVRAEQIAPLDPDLTPASRAIDGAGE